MRVTTDIRLIEASRARYMAGKDTPMGGIGEDRTGKKGRPTGRSKGRPKGRSKGRPKGRPKVEKGRRALITRGSGTIVTEMGQQWVREQS
jgi:hypothetical protein